MQNQLQHAMGIVVTDFCRALREKHRREFGTASANHEAAYATLLIFVAIAIHRCEAFVIVVM